MGKTSGVLQWFRGLSRKHKIAVVSGSVLILYTLFGFVATPFILKKVLEKKIPDLLNRQVAIEKVRLNPYTLSATITGFNLARKEGEGAFVYFDRLYVNLESLSIFKKALIIKSLSLEGPVMDFDFLGNKTYSFSDLLGGGTVAQAGEEKPDAARFSLNNIEIKNGTITFHDLPKGEDHHVVNLNLAIPSISNLPSSIETYVQPSFSAEINGTSTSLGGVTKPFAESLATEININMQGINIPRYLAYIPNQTDLTVKSALMDIDAKLAYISSVEKSDRLTLTGSIRLRSVNVVDLKGQTYLDLPSLTLVSGDSNLLEKEVHLAEISVDTPRFEFIRLVNGDMLPMALLAHEGKDSSGPSHEKPQTEPDTPSQVKLTIDRFNLTKGAVIFTDQALQVPTKVEINEISLQASDLSTLPGTTGAFSYAMQLNGTGAISGEGQHVVSPLSLKSSLNVGSIVLQDFQPYVSEQAKILIADGTLALMGDLQVQQEETGALGLYFSGQSSITDLATADSRAGEDLLKWKELQIRRIKYSSLPPELLVDEIKLQDLYVKVLINEDGTLNLATLGKDGQEDVELPEVAEKDPAEKSEGIRTGMNITINKISLENGQIQFLDKNITPAYGASLTEFNGMVTGLSSQTESRAIVKFDGKVDQQSPLIVSGEINPLSKENVADIKIDFSEFNLSPLSPYTGKYLGQKTSKGKLNLDLSYEIRGQKLDSINKAFLDQFTLGEKVDSPEATSLPVNLAISLLKNRQGEIFLDVPVRGDLDDPEFSICGVIVKVIVNLMAKAATSPFALLGGLIPEGKDIQHVIFDPGKADLTEDAVDSLGLVANVLYERPGLNMDISGQVERSLDRAALARVNLATQIKLEKLHKTGIRDTEKIDLKNITVEQEEYRRYLHSVYKKVLKAATAAERKAVKEEKPPATETEAVTRMEEFILARIRVEDEDLRLLAIDRANRVLSFLVEEGQVEPGRLFVVEPQITEAQEGSAGTGNATMVELLIK